MNRKIGYGAATGALVVIILYVLNTYVTPIQPIPGEIGAAATTVLTYLVSRFVPEKKEGI